eukprot:m51a1_g1196 hypothetical protein (710) ;mRNA; f:442122-445228
MPHTKAKSRKHAEAVDPCDVPWRGEPFVEQTYAPGTFDDAALRELYERGAGIGDGNLPDIAFTSKHVPALVKMARDVKLFRAGVSPDLPLTYLIRLPPEGWTEQLAAEVVTLLNGVNGEEDLGELVHRVLQHAGAIALRPLELYLLDSTRLDDARSFAAETVKNICADGGELLRARGIAVLQQALRTHHTNKPEWNGFLIAMLMDLKAVEALPLIREAYVAKGVDEASCGDYGSVVFDIKGKVDPNDPLVAICMHCNSPAVTCKEALLKENDSIAVESLKQGMALFDKGAHEDAFQMFCRSITCCNGIFCDSIEATTARYMRTRIELWQRAMILLAEAKKECGDIEEAFNDVIQEETALTLSEKRFAYVSNCMSVDVVPFASGSKTLVLDTEACGDLRLSSNGDVLATASTSTHSVYVWDLTGASTSPRCINLGSTREIPERVRCTDSLAAMTSGRKIALWRWRDAASSNNQGQGINQSKYLRWLYGAAGPVGACVMDDDNSTLFACARETRRTCVLEYDTSTSRLRRTLIGFTMPKNEWGGSISPMPTAIACCRSHVVAAVYSGEIITWSRATGAVCARIPGTGEKTRAVSIAIAAGSVVCGMWTGNIFVYSVTNGSTLAQLTGLHGPVTALSTSFRNGYLVLRAGTLDGMISTRRFSLAAAGEKNDETHNSKKEHEETAPPLQNLPPLPKEAVDNSVLLSRVPESGL